MAVSPKLDMDLVEELVRLTHTRQLSELSLQQDGVEITVLRETEHQVGVLQHPIQMLSSGMQAAPVLALPPGTDNRGAVNRAGLKAVESPMIGVFFRSPGPDQPTFVEVGDHVQVGQAVGLIEAMKVFSEIFAETSGTVVEIAAKNSELVQTGQPLLYLRPDAA